MRCWWSCLRPRGARPIRKWANQFGVVAAFVNKRASARPKCDRHRRRQVGELLRWIHVVTTQRLSWDAAIAGAGDLPTAA